MNIAIALFCLALIGSIWMVTMQRVRYEKAKTIAAVTRANSNLAIAFEEHTVRTFTGIDQSLQFLKQEYEREGAKLDLPKLIASGVIDRSIYASVGVIDERGDIVLAALTPFKSTNLADREYFKVQRQGTQEIYIGQVLKGRLSGKWGIPVSRRINKPDGSFGGVVFASVDPAYFSNFYQQTDLGEQGLVVLVGLDGITRARRSGQKGSFGEDMRRSDVLLKQPPDGIGNSASAGTLDGVPRFHSFRRLKQYPLIVSVGVSQAEALAPFYKNERQYYLVAGLASVFIVVFAGWLMIALSRQRSAQERLLYQANYDGLTQLPNRVLYYDRLKHALSHAKRRKWTAGVMFIDLDGFKSVNDRLGHEFGDQLLGQVAQRLRQCVRASDTIGRLGGDEFAIILSELAKAADSAVVAQKVIDALAKPFQLDHSEAIVTASIGIATYPTDSEDAGQLVKNADTAMLRAKALGKNNYQFYTAEMNERAVERQELDIDLRLALERQEFELMFQPKASLTSGEITGCEALLRWRHPSRGILAPAAFIPVLEDSGLIVPVGEWAINAACRQIRAWQQAGLAAVPIAVNLSAKQFQHQDITAIVDKAVREFGIDEYFFEVEITESAAMQNAEDAIVTLRQLKAHGVSIAIDDFGTGYSSLAYLKRFPIDFLKLDRTFVTGLPSDPDDVSITRAVITMAHSLHLKVIAEGVETKEQLAFLAAQGCDEMQGFYFSRPLPADECTQFLRERHTLSLPDEKDQARLPTLG
ncbi:MAG: EAL domain-containing protein [Burkholderiales bacterium]|nr:EAL domain-containing protein [Burkholderiales bacterium]